MFHFTSFPHHRLFAAALGCLAAAALPLPAACGGAPTDGATAYTITDLGTLPGEFGSTDDDGSTAEGINASGQVVGKSFSSSGHAFLYSKGTMTALGTLPGDHGSYATSINANGQVVGYSRGPGIRHAFLYSNGTMTALGMLPGDTSSSVTGLNASGQVVGNSSDSSNASRAFLYSKGKMVDLTARILAGSGWKLTKATGINDSGQICGSGTINDHIHAFLLTPK